MAAKTPQRREVEKLVSGAVLELLASLRLEGLLTNPHAAKGHAEAWAKRRGVSLQHADLGFWDERLKQADPLEKPSAKKARTTNGARPRIAQRRVTPSKHYR